MSESDSQEYWFGQGLRDSRIKRGLSLRQLEVLTGIDRSVLSKFETGQNRNPRPDQLRRLALALDLSETEMFGLLDRRLRDRLPTIRPYLRAKYGLPDDAIAHVTTYLERYGVTGVGPADGEDETPYT